MSCCSHWRGRILKLVSLLLLNAFQDILLVFCIDSHVMLFSLERKNTQASKSIVVERIPGYITGVLYRLTCHVVLTREEEYSS